MSKGSGYVPIDKNLTQELNNIGRPFTRLEAMFSYTVDQDNGKGGSINGYAQLWNWSRNKTRKFLKEIRTVKGHSKDTRRTPDGHPVHFIDKALWISKDSERTVKGHQKDSERDTTNNPNPDPNPDLKEKDLKISVETSEEYELPDISYGFAVGLKMWIISHKKIKVSERRFKTWTNDFRLLAKMDLTGTQDEKEERIGTALKWYLDNAPGEFIPVVESGSSFRKKFTKIEMAMKKDTSSANQWDEVREKYGN